MAAETYIRKPGGQKNAIIKYRVRIRTTVDATMADEDDARLPYLVDELYDTLGEARRGEEHHWISIRTGTASNELMEKIRRLSEPTMEQLLKAYEENEVKGRSESARDVEKLRLTKTIPNVKVYLGKEAEKNGSIDFRVGAGGMNA